MKGGEKLKRIVDENGQYLKTFKGKSGINYYVHFDDYGLNDYRYTKFMQLAGVGMYNTTVDSLTRTFLNLEKCLQDMRTGERGLFEAVNIIQNAKKGVTETTKRDYSLWHFAATFFIIAEDEDVNHWTEQKAIEKMEDWSIYRLEDFFFLGLICQLFYKEKLNQLQTQIDKIASGKVSKVTTE